MKIDVLDHGFVRLDASMADDLSVVNAARISLDKQVSTFSDADSKLIDFLMREKHGTPFEHNAFRFHVKAPIFVAREWFRHRIGSFNEMSGRYTELPKEFYVPSYVRTQVGKPGYYSFEPTDEYTTNMTMFHIRWMAEEAFIKYHQLLEMGVAKEVARMVLPVNIYTQFYWTINARSLMNFLSLRNDAHAQWEIRQYAEAVENIFGIQMPDTYASFCINGRVAP